MSDQDTWLESTHVGTPGVSATPSEPAARASSIEAYLLVLEGATSSVFPVPEDGDVVIGRGDTAQLRLGEKGVSRAHARLTLTAGQGQLADLESQNGTKVNGDRIVGVRPLVSGDVIMIGVTTLVFHTTARTVRAARSLMTLDAFRQRVEDEVERASRSHRPLGLVALAVGDAGSSVVVDQAALLRLADGEVRRHDVVGQVGPDLLLVLLPEADAAAVQTCAERLLRTVRATAPRVRAGLAMWPADGVDVDTLLVGARAAVESAEPGAIITAASTYRTIEIGGHKAMVADPAMLRMIALVERLARADLSVLVCGETGTGKELVATALHHWSSRCAGPLVTLNCAALPEALAESELFGHARGAFSGAVAVKVGILEAGHGGTVFLDEIGELSLAAQAKLLRALEVKRITRVGDVAERDVDIRVVAATNRTLPDEVRAGRFRQDLLYRLGGATVWLPPLRDRRREIPILAQRFLDDACARGGGEPMTISDGAMAVLIGHGWPGNVRELRQVMDYVAVAHNDEPAVAAWHLAERLRGDGPPAAAPAEVAATPRSAPVAVAVPNTVAPPPPGGFTAIEDELRELEKTRMAQALAAADGNQTAAAELLKMPLRSFQAKARSYGLRRKDRG